MKKLLVPAIVALALSQNVIAGSVRPQFNLTGTWQGGGVTASYFQEGTELTYIAHSSNFAHYFVGRYITPTTIEGVQHRINRSTGCSTEMLLIATATSSSSISSTATALDSNCDLIKGRIFTGSATKTQ